MNSFVSPVDTSCVATKLTLEYNLFDEPQLIGQIKLSNTAQADYHQDAKLQVSAKLRKLQQQLQSDCQNAPLRLALLGRDNQPLQSPEQTITLEQLKRDEIQHLGVFLAFDAMGVVFEQSDFCGYINLTALDESNSVLQQQQRVIELTVLPNPQESDLQIECYDQLNPIHSQYRQISDDETLAFDTNYPVLEGSVEHKQVVNFKLRNTANLPDDSEPNNVVKINELRLERYESNEILLFYGYECGYDPVDGKNKRTLSVQQLFRPVVLKPSKEHYLDLQIEIKAQQESPLYSDGELEDCLIIKYEYWNSEKSKYEANTLAISLNIPLREEFTSSVLAVDFGTSALCVAHKTPSNSEGTTIPLGQFWRKIHDKVDEPRENSDELISSELYCEWKNLNNQEVNIAPPTRLPLVLPQSADELPQMALTGAYWLPNVKAYIAASRERYEIDKTNSFEVKSLIEQCYHRVKEDYLACLKDNPERYRRVVITHPNSFVDGQQNFLFDALSEVFSQAQLKAMSESDAVIYYYLRYGMNKIVAPDNPFKHSENILCFDMGGGTLDLSFRCIHFNGVEGVIFPNMMDESGKLLGMVSVAGAGNRINELIAEVLDEILTSLEQWHKSQQSNGHLELEDVTILSRFSKEEDAEALSAQQKGLQRLNDIIQAQKIELCNGAGAISIPLPGASHGGDFGFSYISDKAIELWHQQEPMSNQLSKEGGVVTVEITLEQLESKFKQAFYPQHIYQPLKAICHNRSGNTIPIDTLLISGRSMRFPGLKRELLEHIEHCQPGHRPKVWIVNDPESGDPAEAYRLKSVVAQGALCWGNEAMTGDELFSPPLLLGWVGIAVRSVTGTWQWYPLFNEADIKKPQGQREPQHIPEIDTRMLRDVVILQSFIQDPSQVEEDWLNAQLQPQSIEQILLNLSHSGYFRVLNHTPWRANLFSSQSTAHKIILQLMLYTDLERENMPHTHQETSRFADLKVELMALTSRDGVAAHGGDRIVGREVQPLHISRIDLHWPHSLYANA